MEQSHDLLSNDLQITPATENQLNETAKWSKFLAIVGFILSGCMAIFAFVVGSYLSNFSYSYSGSMQTTITVIYLCFAFLFFLPSLFLYRFSVRMQQALRSVSQELFDTSLQSLKATFRFWGIMGIISVIFFALGLIGMLVSRGIYR